MDTLLRPGYNQYVKIPAKEKELVTYDSGHSLPAAYAEVAAGWFLRYFKAVE